MWSDIRYQSLPEERRLELFDAFMLEVKQQQAAADAAAAAARLRAEAAAAAAAAASSSSSGAATPPAVPQVPAGPGLDVLGGFSVPGSSSSSGAFDDSMSSVEEAAMSPEDLAQLQLLRWEQAKLRTEYLRMEEKLRAMEVKMRSGSSSPVAGAAAAAAAGNGAGSNGTAGHAAAAEASAEQVTAHGLVPAAVAAEAVDVVLKGGEGDVSVEEKDGMVVFRFADGPSTAQHKRV